MSLSNTCVVSVFVPLYLSFMYGPVQGLSVRLDYRLLCALPLNSLRGTFSDRLANKYPALVKVSEELTFGAEVERGMGGWWVGGVKVQDIPAIIW